MTIERDRETGSAAGGWGDIYKERACRRRLRQKKVFSFFFLRQFNRLKFFSFIELVSPMLPHDYILFKSFS